MYNHAIRKITPAGIVSTFAGTPGVPGSSDGMSSAASFFYPGSVAVDSSENVYVYDLGNITIRKITPDGTVSTFAGIAGKSGYVDGIGTSARFRDCGYDTDAAFTACLSPGIVIDSSGNLYVADQAANTIRKITPSGAVTTFAGNPLNISTGDIVTYTNGAPSPVTFVATIPPPPSGLAVDNVGNVYAVSGGTEYPADILKITPAGVATIIAGNGPLGSIPNSGPGLPLSLNDPAGIAIDNNGNVYVSQPITNTVQKISSTGIQTTFAGNGNITGGAVDGNGTNAQFSSPRQLAIDQNGNLYVADANNSEIRKITSSGTVTTVAGMVAGFSSPNATIPTANFHFPNGITVDPSGNLYIANSGSNVINKITPTGQFLAILSPNPDISSETNYSEPLGVAADSEGNVFVANTFANTILKISSDGVVTTLAGSSVSPPGNQDGNGATATFYYPHALTVDSSGNVFVADTYNGLIRKVTPSGDVTTFAGLGVVYFISPRGIVFDSQGNLYVSDIATNLINKITPSGKVSVFAGTANVPGSLDGLGTNAMFNFPYGLAIDPEDNIYVADTNNHVIRKITPAGMVTTVVGQVGTFGFEAGTLPGSLYYPFGIAFKGNSLYITTANGVVVAENFLTN
jgi:sugar lactone lactonase YvrE